MYPDVGAPRTRPGELQRRLASPLTGVHQPRFTVHGRFAGRRPQSTPSALSSAVSASFALARASRAVVSAESIAASMSAWVNVDPPGAAGSSGSGNPVFVMSWALTFAWLPGETNQYAPSFGVPPLTVAGDADLHRAEGVAPAVVRLRPSPLTLVLDPEPYGRDRHQW